jgi:hypothetical protein
MRNVAAAAVPEILRNLRRLQSMAAGEFMGAMSR